jgi:uncharacterized protein YwqG
MAVGLSKIGGTPDLPEGMDWPLSNGKPMSFIAQIRLADAAAFDASKALPKTGTLYFFYDAERSTWGMIRRTEIAGRFSTLKWMRPNCDERKHRKLWRNGRSKMCG